MIEPKRSPVVETDEPFEVRVSFDPAALFIEGAIGELLYIIGEYENEDGDAYDCLIEAPAVEVFRVVNEWIEQKKRYDERHENWLCAGVDPEGTPALKFTPIAPVECREHKYDHFFHVDQFDSPSLENG